MKNKLGVEEKEEEEGALLDKIAQKIVKNKLGMVSEGVLILQEITHKSQIVLNNFNDLSSSNYHLFLVAKKK